jgi:hypothetical protein
MFATTLPIINQILKIKLATVENHNSFNTI